MSSIFPKPNNYPNLIVDIIYCITHNNWRLLAQTKSSLVAPLILISKYTLSDLVDLDPSPYPKFWLSYLSYPKSKVILNYPCL